MGDILAALLVSGDINPEQWTGGLGMARLIKDTPETQRSVPAVLLCCCWDWKKDWRRERQS